MEAYIARGGISHVLSQARASLKNPSRPYTPRTNARPLFSGDDYRPDSRPSSSYTPAEKMELERRMSAKSTVDAPPSSLVPPRGADTNNFYSPDVSLISTDAKASASSTQIKLVHAPPMIFDPENSLDIADDAIEDDSVTRVNEAFDPESSLALPSHNELVESYREIEVCLRGLVGMGAANTSSDFNLELDRLCRMAERFIDLSTFLQSGTPSQYADGSSDPVTNNAYLCSKLFRALCSETLERWCTSPSIVLELTPYLIQLFASARRIEDVTANTQIVQLGKLLFMLSKDSANDLAFCSVRYVEAALDCISSTSVTASSRRFASSQSGVEEHDCDDSVKPLDSLELLFPMKTLIYIAGTLKNLSNGAEDRMLKLLATHRCIPILSETLLWRQAETTTAVASKEIAQFLVQATGILRNLSASKGNSKQFLDARIAVRLCTAIPDFLSHQELMVNISRIQSKLTLHEKPRAQINQSPSNIGHLMALVNPKHNAWLSFVDHPQEQQSSETKSQDMLFVRVFFVLGNLCAGNDTNRAALAFHQGGISVLLATLQFYAHRYKGTSSQNDTVREQSLEILVKLVRLLANIAINAEVAAVLNERLELSVVPELLRSSLHAGDEELMLNTVSFITNLSYFHRGSQLCKTKAEEGSTDGFVERHRLEIAVVLADVLLAPNEEAVLESARTFGNLSRHPDILAYMRENKVLDCFVLLLDHSNREIVFAVCGVLMNSALDRQTRDALLDVALPLPANETKQVNPPVEICGLLTGILVDCAEADDIEMTLMAGKVLFNLLLKDSKDEKRPPMATITTLRRVVESIIETFEHPAAVHRTKKGKRETNDVDECVEDDVNKESADEGRKELASLLPQLLRSVNSF